MTIFLVGLTRIRVYRNFDYPYLNIFHNKGKFYGWLQMHEPKYSDFSQFMNEINKEE